MGFMDHLFSLRRRRKTATTNTTVNTVKPRGDQPPPLEQQKEEHPPQVEEAEGRPLTPSVVALAPSSLASSSVNVDGLEFAESRDLVFLLGTTLDEQPDHPAPTMSFPQFEYILQHKQPQIQNQQDDGVSLPRRSGSSLRSNRLFRALPGTKNDFRLSFSKPGRRGLKNARSTPNFDIAKSPIV